MLCVPIGITSAETAPNLDRLIGIHVARKRKTSPANDIVEIVAAFPWWLGVALAAVSYVVLHPMATAKPAITSALPGQIGHLIVGALTQNLALIGQYLLPFLCLIGSIISVLRRRKRSQLIDNVVANTTASALRDMHWREFEQVVGEAFRLHGYGVHENGGGGADGGIDLVLRKDGEKFLVQCKQWRALKVGVTVIRELYGVMAADGAAGGFVVTCGTFTAEAQAFAHGRNMVLLDGAALEKMIRQTQRGPATSHGDQPVPADAGAAAPDCPTCGKSMLLRTARQGRNAGKRFLGCSAYPLCKGIVAVD